MYNSYLLNFTKFIYLLTVNIFLTPCLYRYRLLLIGLGGFLLFLCPLLIAIHNNRTLKRISARCRGNIAMQQKQINVSRNNQLFWPHQEGIVFYTHRKWAIGICQRSLISVKITTVRCFDFYWVFYYKLFIMKMCSMKSLHTKNNYRNVTFFVWEQMGQKFNV